MDKKKYEYLPSYKKDLSTLQWRMNIFCVECKDSSFFNCLSCVLMGFFQASDKNLSQINFLDYNISLLEEEVHLMRLLFFFFRDHSKHIIESCNGSIKENSSYVNQSCIFYTLKRLFEEDSNSNSLKKSFLKSSFIKYFFENYGTKNISSSFLRKTLPSLLKIEEYSKSLLSKSEPLRDLFIEYTTSILALYNIKIYNIENSVEKYYSYEFNLEESLSQKLNLVQDFLNSKIKIDLVFQSLKLEDKLDFLIREFKRLLKLYFENLATPVVERFCFYLSVNFLNLHKIFPLLVDDYIEEIFLDSIESNIYLDHQKAGRCTTSIKLSHREFETFLSFFKIESNKPLDEENPMLMFVINSKYFHIRVSVDCFPSHWKNYSLDIRKLSRTIYTLYDLIQFGSLNIEVAVFLLLSLYLGINITIAGEVNSGKTTLLNAIDYFSPRNFRRIYIEEIEESIKALSESGHQLKYITEPEYLSDHHRKSEAIYKLLHRSGDLIILGEVLDKKETEAFFHCLSVGLVGLQTTHASSLDGLINRWIIHYNINKSCLNDLGIIVIMKKFFNWRKVLLVAEVEYDSFNDSIGKRILFRYDPIRKDWKFESSIEETMLFRKLNLLIPFTHQDFSFLKKLARSLVKSPLTSRSEINRVYSKIYTFLSSK